MLRRCKARMLLSKATGLVPPIAYPSTPVSSKVAHSFLPPHSISVRNIAAMSEHTLDPRVLDALFQQKRSLRSRLRKQLKNMDPIQRSQEDNAIQNIVLEAPWFRASESMCAYISCASLREVDTSRIVSETKRKLYVPRVEDRNSNMRMLKISSLEDLIANSMNILEPALVDFQGNQREDVMQAEDPVDLIIVPGLAFDKSGRRLGRGGGYYDMFLKKYQELATQQKWKQPLLVAVSYSLQILEEEAIPVTPSDVPVDALVSPAGFMPISPAALEWNR
ncbi:5-formyltetrahydrofolate cyclo-ligase, mitochondrial isoform X2 [Tripterygium wilfordii]|uniref:5-formyltetrahydrofolate cyclo-ligase, mitochondrial isoform X2 n=1 Tax=Tripterygium wilfordii TaxID=458696 RepID=UPI0018F816FE|nr:5-formyltetrahydrofolate cyclo-ligase, mitochondrial isoform X2 [Tripterygium wilfordii]